MAKTRIQCRSCAAIYDADREACPYCGATNPSGAEDRYMKNLNGIKSDMDKLQEIPAEQAGRELKKQALFVRTVIGAAVAVVLLFAVFFFFMDWKDARKEASDFRWQRENFPVMDELYRSGDYTAMAELYLENGAEGRPVWDYEHAGLCEVIIAMQEAEELRTMEEITGDDLVLLLETELTVAAAGQREDLSREELSWIEENGEECLADLQRRFAPGEKDLARFMNYALEHNGTISRDMCEEFLEGKEGEGL